jgi:DNA-binding transcriptional ArsR family regulator
MLLYRDFMDKIAVKTFFFAISDYSRFSILAALLEKDLRVSDIVSSTGIEQSNVSHHMSCLLNCGFVSARKDGKERIYGLNGEVKPIISDIIRHIERYKKEIISCNIANKDYISRAIE